MDYKKLFFSDEHPGLLTFEEGHGREYVEVVTRENADALIDKWIRALDECREETRKDRNTIAKDVEIIVRLENEVRRLKEIIDRNHKYDSEINELRSQLKALNRKKTTSLEAQGTTISCGPV
jgi:predicted nuclease with TOPRIM domain